LSSIWLVTKFVASRSSEKLLSAFARSWSSMSLWTAYTCAKYESVVTCQPTPGDSVLGARFSTSVRRHSALLYFQYRSDCFCTGTDGKTLSAM
jgi:hypothetical protein